MEPSTFWWDFFNMLMALTLILSLVLIAAWLLRRFSQGRSETMNTTSAIKIVERRSLSPKTMIYLLEVDNQRIVVAETPTGVHAIAQMPAFKSFMQET